jgi:hypothetical protein
VCAGHGDIVADHLRLLQGFLELRRAHRRGYVPAHHHIVDVAHGLALLFGLGTKALPSWDSRTRRSLTEDRAKVLQDTLNAILADADVIPDIRPERPKRRE